MIARKRETGPVAQYSPSGRCTNIAELVDTVMSGGELLPLGEIMRRLWRRGYRSKSMERVLVVLARGEQFERVCHGDYRMRVTSVG